MSMTGRYLRVTPETIDKIQANPSSLLETLYPEPEPANYVSKYLDIDKAWHIIHFLLNQEAWDGVGPTFDAVLGGEQLTEEDIGYGPARFLLPSQVQETAKTLSQISPEQLWSRYDESSVQNAELYWDTSYDGKDYALENYVALQKFLLEAANNRDAVILWLA